MKSSGAFFLAAVLFVGCEPYDPDGRLVSPDQVAEPAPPGHAYAVIINPAVPAATAPAPTAHLEPPSEATTAEPSPRDEAIKAKLAAREKEQRDREAANERAREDDTPELFDCIKPKQCSSDVEARAKKRAADAWKCDAGDITADDHPTKGLSVNGSQMVITGDGTAEIHVKPGVEGGKAFALSGCGKQGIIACIPAHRIVKTADVTFDKVGDRVCLWARE